MLQLKRCNLRAVSIQALLSAMRAGEDRGLVGLTFGNGYGTFLQAALPVLEKFGFSATVYFLAKAKIPTFIICGANR